MFTVKGLPNPATACHVSCPQLLLAYALRPLADAILASVPFLSDSSFFRIWAHLLEQLLHQQQSGECIDPTDFYNKVEDVMGIQIHELGDAVTAMTKFLTLIREDKTVGNIVERALYSGKCSFLLTGRQEDLATNTIIERSKQTKEKILPVPFHLEIPQNEEQTEMTLEMVLQKALAPQFVEGYQWSGPFEEKRKPATEITETQTLDEAGSAGDGWKTSKQLIIHELPPYLVIHVDHFVSFQNRVKSHRRKCAIPLRFDPTKWFDIRTQCSNYNLTGAIVYLGNADLSEGEEDGHYVVLVKSPEPDDSGWILVDDTKTTEIDASTAFDLLAGCNSTLSDNGTFMQANLLVYESDNAKCQIQPHVSSLFEQAEEIKRQAISLVGRRLKVLWGKGKYYAGVVASFDELSGKHTIRYDDGDVRSYKLSKKTIEWLDD